VELSCSVVDTGIGITTEVQKELFQPFTQADSSTTRRFGGTGLGLAICHRLTTLMNGRIAVESTPGRGSTFSFTIPLLKAAALTPALTSTAGPSGALPEALRVLVVDDNEIKRKVAGLQLRKLGCAVSLASDGLEAVELWRKEPFDLIFMDCQMPGMDGFEATKAIRSMETEVLSAPRTSIVAMTASAMENDREDCLRAGMDDFIAKPVRQHEISDLLARRFAKPGSLLLL
jgi:two-component system, sensor histidine kinase